MKSTLITLFLPLLFLGVVSPSGGLEIGFLFEAGVRTGITQELVYEGETRISQLDWIDRVAPIVGFTGQVVARNFFSRLGVSFAVPIRSGEMENFDFLIADSTAASHYSWHEIYLDKDFTVGIEGGYEFRLGNFHVTPSLGFRYHNRKWTASGGFLQYPVIGPWTGDEPMVGLHGPVISYEQAIWFPFAALELGFNHVFPRGSRIRLAASGNIYPHVWVEASDIHFLRNIQFYDSMSGGIGWRFGISKGVFPGRANGIGFIGYFGREMITNARGPTATSNTGISDGQLIITEGHSGGTDIGQWHFSLRVFVPLFRQL